MRVRKGAAEGPTPRSKVRGDNLSESRRLAEKELAEYSAYLEDLVTRRTEDLQKANSKLEAEVALHRATVEALRRSETGFKAIAETAPDIIARFDRSFRHLYVNPAVERFTGLSQKDFLGKTNRQLGMSEDLCDLWENLILDVFQTGKVREAYFDFPSPQGLRTLHMRLAPELSSSEEVASVVSVARDVTDAKRARELLQRNKAEVEELVEERTAELLNTQLELAHAQRLSDIGTLAATVAHELRNPLAVIQTAVYNVRKKRSNHSIDKHLASIEKKIAESNQIISNLLNYARLKKPQLKETDISHIIEERLAAARDRFARRKIKVRKRIDAWMRKERLEVDARQMGEVFANIINNAYDAFEDSEGVITVTAQKDDTRDRVLISFTDDGVGMTEADLERSMDPFFTTKSKGTGLGLTICRDIVRLHGGDVAIDSLAGRGTTVTITLPVR